MRAVSITLLALVLLADCGAGEPPEEHVWQEQTDSIDRAKDLEQQMQQDAEERRRKIEEQGG